MIYFIHKLSITDFCNEVCEKYVNDEDRYTKKNQFYNNHFNYLKEEW